MQTNKEMIELKAKKWLNVIAINDFIKNKDGLHVWIVYIGDLSDVTLLSVVEWWWLNYLWYNI